MRSGADGVFKAEDFCNERNKSGEERDAWDG